MPSDLERKLLTLRERNEKAKAEKAQVEGRLARAQERLTELAERVKALGVEPGQLKDELARLESELTAELEKAEQVLGSAAASVGGG